MIECGEDHKTNSKNENRNWKAHRGRVRVRKKEMTEDIGFDLFETSFGDSFSTMISIISMKF